MSNLIENAIKFTAKGEVKFFVTLNQKKYECQFCVSDIGWGIKEEKLTRFYLFSLVLKGYQAVPVDHQISCVPHSLNVLCKSS